MEEKKIVLCGANAYEQKYYFNEQFNGIPKAIKEELRIICILFTEEVGGIFTILFDKDGELFFEVNAAEEDILYDEISSGLLIREIKRKKQDLLLALSAYYKAVYLHMDINELITEEHECF